MGMDIYGLNPIKNSPEPEAVAKWRIEDGMINWKAMESVKGAQEEYFSALEKWNNENPGDYFRANIWWWRPLWECVCYFCDDILTEEDEENGKMNNGYEYSIKTAQEISDRLEQVLKNGDLHKYRDGRNEFLNELPDENCKVCNGTGVREDEIGKKARKKDEEYKCNGCQGRGKNENFAKNYDFDIDFVMDFAKFCEQSGGFSIY